MTVKAKVTKSRTVDKYIQFLALQKKSPITIRDYRYILQMYAKWLKVDVADLHRNLTAENLMEYAEKLDGDKIAPVSRKKYLMVIAKFMKMNGIEFDDEEQGAIKAFQPEERNDKPATKEILMKMMDMGDPHTRSIISFLCSTGCRAGESSQVLLSDVGRIEHGTFVPDINGSVVRIRNEIAKRRKGGLVFLTSEAREYLSIWLQNRDAYIKLANIKSQNLRKGDTGRVKGAKHLGAKIRRPEQDDRLFACSYYSLAHLFGKLYHLVDGAKNKYDKNLVTPHGCRAYFRTHAIKGMSIDLAEGILRHSGYLNQAYVRMTPEDRYQQFKEGEAALFVTRVDHRIQTGELSQLKQENQELKAQMEDFKRTQNVKSEIENTPQYRLAVAAALAAIEHTQK
jgi:integrase